MLNIQSLRSGKKIIYLIIGLIVFALVVLGVFIFFAKRNEKPKPPVIKEKTLEEVIRDLTAPEATGTNQVPAKVIKDLTAPEKGKSSEVPKGVIQGLTAPESR